MFSTLHIIILAMIIPLILAGTYFSLKLSFEKVIRIMLGVGIVSEFIKVFTYVRMNEEKLGGYLPKTDLPFHLCSIQILFLIVLILSKNENVKRILRSFMLPTCLVGGLAAILIPTSSSIRHLNILTFQYFGYHAGIMIFALRMLIGKDVKFQIKDYGTCLLILFVTMFAAIYINSILYNGTAESGFIYEVRNGDQVGHVQLSKVNFMYMVEPPQSGLPLLNLNHGWGVYVIHYMFVCLFAITLVYIKPILDAMKEKRRKKQPVNSD